MAIVSVEESTPMSAIPDIGTWCEGNLNTATRCFDVLVSGKCEAGTSKVKLNVRSVDKIPDFFTKNNEGKAVFAEPAAACVIEAAKGYPSWIQIELKNINGEIGESNELSNLAKHVCLGIRKQNKEEFFDVIHAGKLTSKYVDVTEKSYVELVPLLSKKATDTNEYNAVIPSEEIKFDDMTVPTSGTINFGSVYRINIESKGAWLKDQECDMYKIVDNNYWWTIGKVGVGTLIDKDGQILKNQLVAINCKSYLARSSDGAHWIEFGSTYPDSSSGGWDYGLAYGNGIWCAANSPTSGKKGTHSSTDGGQSWSATLPMGSRHVSFGNNTFMTITDSGVVYASSSAENWVQIGEVAEGSLIYGDDKWICITGDGRIFWSKDGKGTWKQAMEDLQITVAEGAIWRGGCYANGYFYAIADTTVARSFDGEHWEKVTEFSASGYENITYFKGKLWAFRRDGTKYNVGLIR